MYLIVYHITTATYYTLYILWGWLSWDMILYFHKVDKIAFGSSYKTLKSWEIHTFISQFRKILSRE